MYRVGWFSSGRDEAAGDLLTVVQDGIRRGEIKADICYVFSNREPGQSLESDRYFELVRMYDIPLICYSSQRFQPDRRRDSLSQWRLEYDREVMTRLEGYSPDICMLAGYMLIVGSEMCREYTMINLHPAAPGGPSGTWQEVIWKLIASRAEGTGVVMHLATPDLDQGPPVTFCTFAIRGGRFDHYWRDIEGLTIEEIKTQQGENNPLFRLIREHGLARELPLITATIKAFSQGRVRIEGEKVVNSGGRPIDGYDLTAEIDEMVQRKDR